MRLSYWQWKDCLTGMQLHVFTRADMQELARKAGKSLKPDELFGKYRDVYT